MDAGAVDAGAERDDDAPEKLEAPTRRFCYTGDPAPVLDILRRAAMSRGKSFVRYDESPKVAKSKLDAKRVTQHVDILAELKRVSPNLSFGRKVMKTCLEKVCSEFGEAWGLSPEQGRDWVLSISLRVRNMCFAVASAERKKPLAKWLESLPWNSGAPPDGSSASPVVAGKAVGRESGGGRPSAMRVGRQERTKRAYSVSWNTELGLPVRKEIGVGGKPELGNPLSLEELRALPSGHSAVVATFRDGAQLEVPELTKDVAMAMMSGRRSHEQDACLWESEVASSKNRLHIAQRTDRFLLLSMYEQQKQVLQLRLDRFGPLDQPQPKVVARSHPTLAKALEFMIPLGVEYASGAIQGSDALKLERDKRLAALDATKAGGRRVRGKRAEAAGTVAKQEKQEDGDAGGAEPDPFTPSRPCKEVYTKPARAAPTAPAEVATPAAFPEQSSSVASEPHRAPRTLRPPMLDSLDAWLMT